MRMSITEAKAQLTELVRRAEAGDEVVLTRHGRAAVKLVPVERKLNPEERERLLRELQAAVGDRWKDGPCAARSQDFLYDENGLPA